MATAKKNQESKVLLNPHKEMVITSSVNHITGVINLWQGNQNIVMDFKQFKELFDNVDFFKAITNQ